MAAHVERPRRARDPCRAGRAGLLWVQQCQGQGVAVPVYPIFSSAADVRGELPPDDFLRQALGRCSAGVRGMGIEGCDCRSWAAGEKVTTRELLMPSLISSAHAARLSRL